MAALLVMTVLLPLIVGPLMMLMPSTAAARPVARGLALAATLLTLAAAVLLVARFPAGDAGYHYAISLHWLAIGQGGAIKLALGLDGLSLWLYAMTPLLGLTAILASWESITNRAPVYYGLTLTLLGALMGAFASMDVLLFYVFFELTLVPAFFLIGIFGGPDRRRAAMTFFLYTLAGSLFMLVGLVALTTVLYQHSANHTLTFSIPALTAGLRDLPWDSWREHGTLFSPSPQVLIFTLLLAGFAVKVPLFPFHSWLPITYQQAPTPITILIAGVMSKLGAYGLIRLNLSMTPIGAQDLFPMLAVLSVIAILYGALNALAESNLKRMIAYSSLSHMGFIALGIFALNPTALEGAAIQMVNHAITTSALFLAAGVIYAKLQLQEMDNISGLWSKMPLFAFFVIVAALGSAALPGLNGFVGEFPILAGAFETSAALGVWASLGMILGAYYLMAMVRKVIFGQPSAKIEQTPNMRLNRPEIIAFTLLTAIIFYVGVRPAPVLDRMRPPVSAAASAVAKAAPPATVAGKLTASADADARTEN